MPVIHNTNSAAFSLASPRLLPPQLSQPTRSRDQVTELRAQHESRLERGILGIGEKLDDLPGERYRLDEPEHAVMLSAIDV